MCRPWWTTRATRRPRGQLRAYEGGFPAKRVLGRAAALCRRPRQTVVWLASMTKAINRRPRPCKAGIELGKLNARLVARPSRCGSPKPSSGRRSAIGSKASMPPAKAHDDARPSADINALRQFLPHTSTIPAGFRLRPILEPGSRHQTLT